VALLRFATQQSALAVREREKEIKDWIKLYPVYKDDAETILKSAIVEFLNSPSTLTVAAPSELINKDEFYVEGCIDEENDLWGNTACLLHIDSITCGRESSCKVCENYVGKVVSKPNNHHKIINGCHVAFDSEPSDELQSAVKERFKNSDINEIMEKGHVAMLDEVIEKHMKKVSQAPFVSSVYYFADSGIVSGSLLIALRNMLDEYGDICEPLEPVVKISEVEDITPCPYCHENNKCENECGEDWICNNCKTVWKKQSKKQQP
jgi:hypothetical protein